MLLSSHDILRHLSPVGFGIERECSFSAKYARNYCVVIRSILVCRSLPNGSLLVKQHTFPNTSTPFRWEVAEF